MVFTTIDSCKQTYIEVCVRDKPHDASVCIVLVRMQCAQIRRAIFSHIQREPLFMRKNINFIQFKLFLFLFVKIKFYAVI